MGQQGAVAIGGTSTRSVYTEQERNGSLYLPKGFRCLKGGKEAIGRSNRWSQIDKRGRGRGAPRSRDGSAIVPPARRGLNSARCAHFPTLLSGSGPLLLRGGGEWGGSTAQGCSSRGVSHPLGSRWNLTQPWEAWSEFRGSWELPATRCQKTRFIGGFRGLYTSPVG